MNQSKSSSRRYQAIPPTGGEAIEMTSEQLEEVLLNQLDESADRPVQAMFQLARFYRGEGKIDLVRKYLASMREEARSAQDGATLLFVFGQAAERYRDYVLAVVLYRGALELNPTEPTVRYFVHNNLGYSLNQVERFKDGERYCRRAIEIDNGRSNGHKNLGLALQGQGRYREAAEAFVAATLANARDGRSAGHLKQLLHEHSELEDEFAAKMKFCRDAVLAARG